MSNSSNRYVSLQSNNAQAELLLLDETFRIVAKGVSPLHAYLPLGLYIAKAKIGDDESEHLFRVVEGIDELIVTVAAPKFESPIPLAETSTSNESHVAAADRFLQPDTANLDLGGTSEIMIYIRDPSYDNEAVRVTSDVSVGRKSYLSSFFGFRLLDGKGDLIIDLDRSAEHNIANGFAAITAKLPAGPYVLAYYGDKYSCCFSLPAVIGWTLQCYINLVPASCEKRALAPDLMGMAITYGRMDEGFSPSRDDVIASETIRKGMLEGRTHIDTPHMREILSSEFQNPMLGLYAVHLLLDVETPDFDLIRIVMDSIQKMLGMDHPDIVALTFELRRRLENSGNTEDIDFLSRLKGPPILTRSWDFLLKAVTNLPTNDIINHPAFVISRNSIGEGVYLNWFEEKPKIDEIFSKSLSKASPENQSSILRATNSLGSLNELMNSASVALTSIVRWAKTIRQLDPENGNNFLANEISQVKTNNDAAKVLSKLAINYPWKKIIPEIRRKPNWLQNLSGLRGELIFMLRDISDDQKAISAIDEEFIQKFLEARRIPLASLIKAMADIELGGWGASSLLKVIEV